MKAGSQHNIILYERQKNRKWNDIYFLNNDTFRKLTFFCKLSKHEIFKKSGFHPHNRLIIIKTKICFIFTKFGTHLSSHIKSKFDKKKEIDQRTPIIYSGFSLRYIREILLLPFSLKYTYNIRYAKERSDNSSAQPWWVCP